MSNQKRVYQHVLRGLKQALPHAPQGHTVTLAMLMTGILLGKTVQFEKMAGEIPAPIQDASIAERLRRWVRNPNAAPEVFFTPFATALLAALADTPLVLAMDASSIGRGCQVLVVGVVYQQRLLPVAWVVYKGGKGHAPASTHIAVLEQVLPLLPPEATVILLGDGEYDSVEMLTWVATHTAWESVVRTAKSAQVTVEGEPLTLDELALAPGDLLSLSEVGFTQQEFGPVQVVCHWDAQEEAPIYLVTNLELAAEAVYWYKKRFKIETLFSDKKTRGFHLHKSGLTVPARLARLFMATSLAYIWVVYMGVACILTGAAPVGPPRPAHEKPVSVGAGLAQVRLKTRSAAATLDF